MTSESSAPAPVASALETSTMRKINLRIIPFVVICMFVSYIDRVNVGFAAIQMNQDLGFSATAYGWGVSAFFISLCLFEVPSNMMMKKIGARIWFARIMITWGLISAGTAFIIGTKSFISVRFLLGAAEAGFFPGVILYLTYWFPRKYRAKAMSIFVMALPISNFIGSPISGQLLNTEGWLGLHGWQWLFIFEALPAVLLGVITLFWLSDTPETAKWLAPEQQAWLKRELDEERKEPSKLAALSTWRTMWHPRVLALALIYSGSVGCSYALSYWQPQMIKEFGLSNAATGWVNAIPFGFAAIGMVLWAHRSDRSGERRWHTALPLLFSAIGLAACLCFSTLTPTMVALTVALVGAYAVKAPLFALTAESLSDRSAAVGIAQVCAIGNIAGGVSPLLIGWIKDLSGSYMIGLSPMIFLALVAAVTTLLLNRRRAGDPIIAALKTGSA